MAGEVARRRRDRPPAFGAGGEGRLPAASAGGRCAQRVATRPGRAPAHVDEAAIARLAFEHLRSLGLRQFAFCGPTDRVWALQRRDVFTAAATEANMPVHVYEFSRHLRTQELASRRAERLVKWLRKLPRPIGVLAANDSYAWLVSTACRLAAWRCRPMWRS